MKLSIVVVTNRVGGLDVLRVGLEQQTYRDFELILVDELGDRRRFQPSSFPVTHLGPEPGPRWGNYMRALNRALEAASGDRLVFWSDYTCPGPDTLRAFNLDAIAEPDAAHLGDIDYVQLPSIAPKFPIRYGYLSLGHDQAMGDCPQWYLDAFRQVSYEHWRSNYEADLSTGQLDPFMRSTFEEPLTVESVAQLPLLPNGRQSRVANPHLNLKNDSIPRELLQRAGGFDERADGTHGHQDSITYRRLARYGLRLVPVPGYPVRLLDPHNLMIIRRMDRPDTANLSLYESYA